MDGEIRGVFHDRHLTYGRDHVPMRAMLAQPLRALDPGYVEPYHYEATGLKAEVLLKGAMSPGSYEDFQILRETYPDHVIEFTVYDAPVGDIPHRNTIVWEVRLY